MKNKILILLLIFSTTGLMAQSTSDGIPISVSYFSHALIQPGAKIGTYFSLKEWESEATGKKGEYIKQKNFYVSPQIGFYSRPNKHSNFLLNADIGYKRIKNFNRTYSAFSVGLGYMSRSQITSIVYSLSDGSIKEKKKNQISYFLPTINYEFGRAAISKWGWFTKFSYGVLFSTEKERTGVVLVELGLNFNLNKN